MKGPPAPHRAHARGGALQEGRRTDEEVAVIVEVVGGADELPEVRVVDADDLGRLHLALGAVTDEEADRALRSAAEAQAGGEGWAQQWDDMVRYAGSKGWVTDDGASLKVHVESAAGA